MDGSLLMTNEPGLNPLTRIWLARHAEAHNPGDVLYGRLPNVRLSAAGLKQTRVLAEFLATRPLAAVYASPMLRARRTAAAVAERQGLSRIRIDRDLHEVGTGWQGQPSSALAAVDWDFYAHPLTDSDESLTQIRDRMRRWLNRVARRHAGTEVLGVSHGDPLMILLADLRGFAMDLPSIRRQTYPPPSSAFEVVLDANGELRSMELFLPAQQQAA